MPAPNAPTSDRRRHRTHLITQALTYQLSACCEDGRMQAMVLSDEDGLPLAASGDSRACDELAAAMAHVGARATRFRGTLLRSGTPWDIEMTTVMIGDSPLVLCAAGGSPDERTRQIARGAQGALRILGASAA